MAWLFKRLDEPSTWGGFGLYILAGQTFAQTLATAHTINASSVVMALAATLAVFKSDKGGVV